MSSTGTVDLQNRIERYVRKSLQNENVLNFTIDVSNAVKTDGFVGDIFFVAVTGTSSNNKPLAYNLALKLAKQQLSKSITEVLDVLFDTEIYLYNTVIPFYGQYQRSKGLLEELNFIPKCFGTVSDERPNAVIMKNLKVEGYELHQRDKPLNFQHVKNILEVLGKWHALSFAIKHEQREKYELIVSKLNHGFEDLTNNCKHYISSYVSHFRIARKILKENKNYVLLAKLNKITEKGDVKELTDLFLLKEEKSVIVHGDCWANNFLFQYGINKECPKNIAILDCQLSCLRSPVFDISNLIYGNLSKNELDRFDELIKIYYGALSNHLRKLGLNAEELFSYSDLMEHWKKYSKFGLLTAVVVIVLLLTDPEELPVFEDEDFDEKMDQFDVRNREMYYDRIKNIFEHYNSSLAKL